MHLLSIDCETTGVDVNNDKILELAVISQADQFAELKVFHTAIAYARIEGNAYALAMNVRLLAHIGGYGKGKPLLWADSQTEELRIRTVVEAANDLAIFLANCMPSEGKFNVCGKNVGSFDVPLLLSNGLLTRATVDARFNYGYLDPGPMFAIENDRRMPSLETVLGRAGVDHDTKTLHSAYWDARYTLEAVRAGLQRNSNSQE
jgi:oligoribonuclease (3'-5' exoribonuclease)